AILIARLLGQRTDSSATPASRGGAFAWFFLAASIAVPLTLLTLDVAKSPVVAGILVVPLLWLFLLPVVRRFRGDSPAADSHFLARVAAACAAVAVGCGVFTQLSGFSQRYYLSRDRAQVRRLLEMYDTLAHECEELRLTQPRVSIDRMADSLF